MEMKMRRKNGAGVADRYTGASEGLTGGLGIRDHDGGFRLKGKVWIKHEDRNGNVLDELTFNNVITKDASIFLARLCKDPSEPSSGVFALAVGTGDVGWDLQNPPAATSNDRALSAEVARKQVSSTAFIDSGGNPTAIPTNIVDFTTTFSESEAVGPLVEMGLIAAPVDTTPPLTAVPVTPASPYDPALDMSTFDTLFNSRHFPVINKQNTTTLTIVWRITF
jgi:hypothetical protein